MTRRVNHRFLLAALMGGLVLIMAPLMAEARFEGAWIDQLTGNVLIQKTIDRAGNYDPYFGQLEVVRTTFREGDWHKTYVAMNRFMDMLEAREGGISAEAADAIWDFCYKVTPASLHGTSRHLKVFGPEYIEALDKMERNAALSF